MHQQYHTNKCHVILTGLIKNTSAIHFDESGDVQMQITIGTSAQSKEIEHVVLLKNEDALHVKQFGSSSHYLLIEGTLHPEKTGYYILAEKIRFLPNSGPNTFEKRIVRSKRNQNFILSQ